MKEKINESVNILPPTKIHKMAVKSVQWIVNILVRYQVEPNILTIVAVIFAVCAGIFLGFGWWLPTFFLILLNSLFDMIDGELSRKLLGRPVHLQKLGSFLDHIADRFSDSVLFLGLIYYVNPRYSSGFTIVIVAALAAHLSSSWIRAKIESFGLRFHRQKPFTRPTLLLALLVVCLGMYFIRTDYQPQFFFYSVLCLICLPKIGTFCAWLRRAVILITTGRHAGVFS